MKFRAPSKRTFVRGSSFLSTLTICLFVSLFTGPLSSAAILLEDGGKPVSKLSRVSARAESKTAEDGYGLRKIRRVGIGVQILGPLGLAGGSLELNFTPEHSFIGGYGGGSGFQSFTLQYKRVLGGTNLLPYLGGGFSRWYSVGRSAPVSNSSSPTVLSDRLLDDQERATGIYALNLIYPTVGLQLIQPSGPWAGSSLYVEAMMLMDISDLTGAPTGTVGYTYYF